MGVLFFFFFFQANFVVIIYYVQAATLTKLVERLTHPITPDSNSIQPFLATYRSFCTGSQLLDLLISRYCVPPPKDKSPENLERYKAKLQTPVQLR